MIKLTTIKKLILQPRIQDVPKYLVFVGVLYSAILPITAVGQQASMTKPALLALADIQSFNRVSSTENLSDDFILVNGSALFGQTNPVIETKSAEKPVLIKKAYISPSIVSASQNIIDTKYNVIVTAYSSTVDQCDDTPFITAKGTQVRDGIVAANWLPFGTKIRLPEVYGDKVFVVEDRMAKKNSHKLDIWMETREAALQFGKKTLTVEILEI